MRMESLKNNIAGVDIYILDQILKGRYKQGDTILDAGCGSGRNLKWFYNAGYKVYGIDQNKDAIAHCKEIYVDQHSHFKQATLENIPFESSSFNHVICNAVLHFAVDLNHYTKMFNELLSVLKPGGSLFIRMASNFGMENDVNFIADGNYSLPDGSKRFLLTQSIFDDILNNNQLYVLEDLKTTLVYKKRCMSTLVIQKK